MSMFEVGDIITGKPKNNYVVTTDKAIMRVISTNRYSDLIRVMVLRSSDCPGQVGGIFSVREGQFILCEADIVEVVKEELKFVRDNLVKPNSRCRSNKFSTKNECVGRIVGCNGGNRSYSVRILYSNNHKDIGLSVRVSESSLATYNYEKEYSAIGLKVNDIVACTIRHKALYRVVRVLDGEQYAFQDVSLVELGKEWSPTIRIGRFRCEAVPNDLNKFWLKEIGAMSRGNLEALISKIPESPAKKDIFDCAKFLDVFAKLNPQEG